MSTAHRPTWDPAQAKDTKAGSRQFSVRDMAAHTKLKFRYVQVTISPNRRPLIAFGLSRQPGQTSIDDVKKRDLRLELLAAEAEARNKKRKAQGKPPLEEDVRKAAAIEAPKEGTSTTEDDEANKRRKLLQEALEMDKDDDEDDEEEKDSDDADERYALERTRQIPDFLNHKHLATRIPKRRTIRQSSSANSRRSNAKGRKKRRDRMPSKILNRRQIERPKLQLQTLCSILPPRLGRTPPA